jgi:hypothetical protein
MKLIASILAIIVAIPCATLVFLLLLTDIDDDRAADTDQEDKAA